MQGGYGAMPRLPKEGGYRAPVSDRASWRHGHPHSPTAGEYGPPLGLAALVQQQGDGFEGGAEALAEAAQVDHVSKGRHGREVPGVGIPPEFLHAWREIDIKIARAHEFLKAEPAVGSPNAALLEASVRGGADGKAGDEIVDENGSGGDAARYFFGVRGATPHAGGQPKRCASFTSFENSQERTSLKRASQASWKTNAMKPSWPARWRGNGGEARKQGVECLCYFLRLFYARHHPTICCSLVRHPADSQERDRKPRQRRTLLPSPPLSRFPLSLN